MFEVRGKMLAQREARAVDGVGVDFFHLLGDIARGRQTQGFGGERRVVGGASAITRPQAAMKSFGQLRLAAGTDIGDGGQQHIQREALAGFPAIE